MRIALALLAVMLLAGCTAAPPKADVTERLFIELEASTDGLISPDDPATVEIVESIADDALEGNCGKDGYWVGLADGDKSLVYAWASTCAMYFEHDMSESQRERARDLMLEQALVGVE